MKGDSSIKYLVGWSSDLSIGTIDILCTDTYKDLISSILYNKLNPVFFGLQMISQQYTRKKKGLKTAVIRDYCVLSIIYLSSDLAFSYALFLW